MRQIVLLSILLAGIILCSCSESEKVNEEIAAINFRSLSSEDSGINFANNLSDSEDLNIIEYLYYYNGAGVAIGDINNDGLDDIYFSGNQTSDKLYLNLGNLKFKDISEEAGLQQETSWSTGVTMEDVNNDGHLDIYVSKVGRYKNLNAHNLLYINNGNSTFEEASEDYGLNFSGFSTQASFFDYDNDGDMDVYLLNHSVHNTRSYGGINNRMIADSLAGDKFYENKINEGIQKFEDVTEASKIYSSALGYGLAIGTSDINNDGYIDIYVGNDFHENDYLYINQGDKSFKESSAEYFQHTARFTMGLDIADINNDHLLDIFTLDMMPFDHEIFLKSGGEDSDKVFKIKEGFGFQTQYARNTLQLNRGNNFFADVALMTETHATDWSWSTLIEDYDNDGYNDIYVTNGIYKRPNDLNYINYLSNVDFAKYQGTKQNQLEETLISKMPSVNIPNVVFRNNGNLEFERFTSAAGQKPSFSNGAAYGDLDNDGDIDIVVNNINQEAAVLENISSKVEGSNNYISLSLKGNEGFKNTTGSKITLYANDKTFYKELTVTRGFQSSSSHKIHFGLGNISQIDSIIVKWLDGKTQMATNLEVNQSIAIKRELTFEEKVNTKQNNIIIPDNFIHRHLENNYLDYDKEVLMPEKLSSEGPAAVKGDFNGDGMEDIFIGGAKYQKAALLLAQKNGTFLNSKDGGFAKDYIYEDVDALALDIDNDNDLDLYVMSGGNENAENSDYLEDRIYINDGKAVFRRLPLELIKTNGGSVSTSDFNKDGHADLFIGSRSTPGGYGLSPFSFILKNNGDGQFNVVEKLRMGMVTDSEWADLNQDGALDLVVVGDWMPITVFINKGDGAFKNATKELGLHETHGMWNSISIGDINQDGKNDIVAGNAGLNFKLKASLEKPVKLYIDDFDKNSSVDPIIFYDFFGENVPYASKDNLTTQLPVLKKKFLDYEVFSKIKNITDLTGIQEDQILEVKKITEMRSMLFLNEDGKYEGIPLPKEAQMSSIEDIHIDFTADQTKLIFVGNYLDYTNELGKSDANSGGILRYSKEQQFSFEKYLPLPSGLNSRKIIKLDDNTYLVVSNNDKSYLIDILKN